MSRLSAPRVLLSSFLLFSFLGTLSYLAFYVSGSEGWYTQQLPRWTDGCSRDATHRVDNCQFVLWLNDNVLEENIALARSNMERQMFIWHHIASVIIFFIVTSAFVISLYFAYLEFVRERESPTGTNEKIFSAKFLGMEFSSSMIGLSILIVSFAFFMTYLKWVYPITGTTIESAPSIPQPASSSTTNSPAS
jgi:hypothetical protein